MSALYEDGMSAWPTPLSKTINVNDCMKLSKKLSVNNEQIAKLLKTKEHTKTWIKNVEKVYKTRNNFLDQPVVNYDVSYNSSEKCGGSSGADSVSTPSMYPPVLPIPYSCSFCRSSAVTGVSQYHQTLSFPYVLLCSTCSGRAR